MDFEKTIRKVGYLTDQKGIYNRYQREKDNWNNHITQTKQFIQSQMEKYRPSSVAVLGSGWLLDIPAEWLAQNCQQVFLVDVCHPLPSQQLQQNYPNVVLLKNDLSGCAVQVRRVGKMITGRKNVFMKIEPAITLDIKADYWFSVNMLDQLDTIPVDYVRKKIRLSETESRQFRRKVQEAHMSFLKTKKSSLICSVKEKCYTMHDELKEENSLIHTELPDKIVNNWSWIFDTTGSYYPNRKTIFDVVATDL